jgi:hypothetical protein
MSLFGDRRDAIYGRACALVDEVVRALGVDPGQALIREVPHQRGYLLRRGSARIGIRIEMGPTEQDFGRIEVIAPLLTLSHVEQRQELLESLLRANATKLGGAAFGLVGDEVVLRVERSLRDLDLSEVEGAVHEVGRLADMWDDDLRARFGSHSG